MSYLIRKRVATSTVLWTMLLVLTVLFSAWTRVYAAGQQVGSFTLPAAGSVLTSDGTTVQGVADVSAGSVLTSAGAGSQPAYSASPSLTAITLSSNLTLSGNTAKAMLYSDASKNVVSTGAPTNGQILIGDTGNIPALSTLTAGTGITIANTAHTITISSSAGSQTVTAQTSNYSVLAADTGTVFTTTGASGTVIFTLPAGVTGYYYRFYIDATQTLEVLAPASNTIRLGGTISATAGNIQASVQGGSVTLLCIASNEYISLGYTGSWAVN